MFYKKEKKEKKERSKITHQWVIGCETEIESLKKNITSPSLKNSYRKQKMSVFNGI